ncbi:PREDICTED: DNA polymerase V-like [Populus euphratica]|uniref:DNA polymerase V-like n=1 Tax=Populus euphratica TaxID=75702 RepID=A0AAJ6T295_POPEU|nr:PREDICTED: DNA polymerase V-like [Populus euphratica]XP_011002978.1 PREDICTED: DNA polymerase V-like [Populus euphratica]XP_011002986.1 PREDICTED: DNA polymerase V-like [Populus euphratica]
MGSKKRSPNSVAEVEDLDNTDTNIENAKLEDTSNENASSNSSRKKMKKDKNKETKAPDGDASKAGLSTIPSSMKPMERRKKRKALDKERLHAASESKEVKTKKMDVDSKVTESKEHMGASSSGTLPKFHIGVFKDLASVDVSVREGAVERLVTELQEVQKAYEVMENKEVVEGGLKLEAEKDDGLNDCAPSVRYAVRRLVRGASSSRECARQGFALGLTVLVDTIPSVKVDSVLKLIADLLEVSSSMKGQDIRDCLLGRLFAYGALALSRRLTEEWISDHNTLIIKEFTNVLISLAAKKRYLQEPAVAIILELVEKLPTEAVLNHILEAPRLREWFEGGIDAGNPDTGNPDALLLALRIREKISIDSEMFGRFLPHPFSPSRLFVPGHLSSIINCLKESTFCQPRVHGVWPVLVNILLPDIVMQAEDVVSASNSLKKHKKSRKSSSSEEEISRSVRCFCEVIIEGSLLLSSHDRKHLAFDILLLLLPRLPASFIPYVFSHKIVQCMVDVLSTKDSWLYKVAQHFLKELSDWVGNDDVRRVAVIVALQRHSNARFDGITKTKTVKALVTEFKTESGCMLFIQNLMNMFVDEGNASEEPSDQSQTTDDNSEMGSVEDKDSNGAMANSDFLKTWVVESLPSILKHLKLEPEAKFRVQKEILKFLAVQGLFSASLGSEVTSFELQEKFKWPKAATSSAICRMCIEQIQSLLANAQKIEGLRSLSSGLEHGDLGSYFMHFLSTLRNIPSVSLFRSLSDDDEKAIEKLQEMETRLSREEKNCVIGAEANKLHAMRFLLIQLLLQVLLRPGEFSEAASELIICCKKAFAASDLLDSGEEELDNDADPKLMDVLVDTFLSLLPQSSAPLRSAIEQVFKYFCNDVTNDGLLRMLRVIKKDLKPPRHREEGRDDGDDDDEDFLGIEEVEEEGEGEEEMDEAETGETGEDEEQTDDSEAVAEVEEAGKELSDDSDGGMDDDAMFRMDAYLAQIFKDRKNQAGGETAQSQLVLFKLRVLSLLEVYLHENPAKPEVLMVYLNLARAFVNPQTAEISEQLGQRIWGILQKKILKAKDFPRGDAVQLPTLESLLEKNLKLASKPLKRKKSAGNLSKKKQSAMWNRHKMIVSLAQDSTFWILKIIGARSFSECELQGVIDIFKGELARYFESKTSQIKSDFLTEIFRRRPWIGHHLFGFLLEKCSSAKLEFRRVEALDLVIEILKSMVSSGNDESNRNASKKVLKNHLQKLSHLIKELATNMPEKPSRRAEARKFCGKVFRYVSTYDLTKSFLKYLAPEAEAACESQLGELYLNFKKIER